MNKIIHYLKGNSLVICLGLVGSLLSVVSNFSGVGWSWDSSDYVAVGVNLANGHGLLDATGLLMTVRPPGLSVLIALGIWIGISANLFLLMLNALCSAIVVLGTYKLLKNAHVNHITLFIATSFVAFSPALLWQYSMAWSEPPFIALLVISMIVSQQKMTYSKATLMTLLMTALFFIRYVGPVFATALTLSSVLVNRKQLGTIKSIFTNIACFVISLIPVWIWLVRNKRIDGTLTGARAPGGGSLLAPLKTLTGTFGSWILGKPVEGGIYLSWNDYPASAKVVGIGFLFVLVILLVIYGWISIKEKIWTVKLPHVLILCALISLSYIGFSAYRFVHWELGPLDNRMMIPIYVPIIIILAIVIEKILPKQKFLRVVVCGIFIVSLGIHLTQAVTDAIKFGRDGRHWSANSFQNSPINQFAKSLPTSSSLLSNQPQQLFAIWQQSSVFNQSQLDAAQKAICEHRYFVWYNSTYDDGTVNLEGQPEQAIPIYSDDSGTVFDLGACSSDIAFYWP